MYNIPTNIESTELKTNKVILLIKYDIFRVVSQESNKKLRSNSTCTLVRVRLYILFVDSFYFFYLNYVNFHIENS